MTNSNPAANSSSILCDKKRKSMDIINKPKKPSISTAYPSYWHFAAKRQQAFFARVKGLAGPWCDDAIINQYKFTNAYRASDRVSQYLIKHVLYDDDHNYGDTFLRLLLFKLFNKIETWQLLNQHFGAIKLETFNVEQFDKILEQTISSGERIYSAAYIMPSGNQKKYGKIRKHKFHLQLIEHLIKSDFHQALAECPTMKSAYQKLLSIDSIGKFLAYQLVTDFNYSRFFNYSEQEFVVAGPGALDGVRKCFTSLGDYTPEDAIKWMSEIQEQECQRYEVDFQPLFGRQLQYIDCQNLFCETDKYCRVAHPDIQGISGRTRIKQVFKPQSKPLELFYPPKWHITPSA